MSKPFARRSATSPANPGARTTHSLPSAGGWRSSKKSPSYNTLQSSAGAHLKTLIRAWVEHDGARMVKRPAPPPPAADQELLRTIADPALRSEIGFRLAEFSRLAQQLQVHKGKTTLSVDVRPKDGLAHAQGGPLQLITPAVGLLDSERTSLAQALDESSLRRLGITIGEDGELLFHGKMLFGFGFATGLRKLLGPPAP